ncbi:Arf-GAP with SH3 domain, ANK repeat and PH domain-containing protein 1 [Portunus trituberculatus]|uniref:Arf-GAP with SH3 domain, ANK repeat and PH domain-containing protein 1 n=1 Tax=Portunus trituberculatus TaxID=210409 RepID=A0A5B7GZU3_PORTR|nr:Arf-GAP with SH3 domain, ANK repeat and PH domain-containing protein 1 [Portunus trituberculatus]
MSATQWECAALCESCSTQRYYASCGTMPEFISVNDYISEVKDDISSPPTSNFVSKMPLCRQTVNELEEVRTCIPRFLLPRVS